MGLARRVVPLSKNPDQRENLVIVFHALYQTMRDQRVLIRCTTEHYLCSSNVLNAQPVGGAGLLSAMVPVVQGLGVPLGADSVRFLNLALMPLHTSVHLAFSTALVNVMAAFIERKVWLIVSKCSFLAVCWPASCAVKQLLWLN